MLNLRQNLGLARMMAKGGYYAGVVLRGNATLCAGSMLEQRAKRTPHHPALLFEDRRYSYSGLNAAAKDRVKPITPAFVDP